MPVTTTSKPFEPDFATSPGEFLEEWIEDHGVTRKEAARRLDTSEQNLHRLLGGEQAVSHEMAERLGRVTRLPAEFWLRAEMAWGRHLQREAEREAAERELDRLADFPVAGLKKLGHLPDTRSKPELLLGLLSFFGVGSLAAWDDLWARPAVSARRSQKVSAHPAAVSAWVRLGQLQAETIDTEPYDRARFLAALDEIRGLTRLPVAEFEPRMRAACAAAGVAFCMVPELKGCPWHAASQWLTKDKAMILLGLRYKTEDHFWFSFFHEAGHLIHDRKKDFVDNDGDRGNELERRANAFAADRLVPARHRPRLLQLRSHADVERLADELGISPGIVVGQHHNETKTYTHFRKLQRKFEWQA